MPVHNKHNEWPNSEAHLDLKKEAVTKTELLFLF